MAKHYLASIDEIEPTGYTSPRRAEEPKPEYLPVSPSKHVGEVTYYNAERGFGKINGDVFFHFTAIIDGNKAFLREGVTVAYEEGTSKKGGVAAVDVQLVASGGSA